MKKIKKKIPNKNERQKVKTEINVGPLLHFHQASPGGVFSHSCQTWLCVWALK